jgi:GH24 family phage-related lysozyme (muramidase)
MFLKKGDSGDVVKALQRDLNKVGSMLLVDGDFGPGTVDAVAEARVTLQRPGPAGADDALQQALAAVPDPLPALTAAGITFIGRAEVASAGAYQRSYRHPIWPGGESGVTIGIGYDLRFVNEPQLRADWSTQLPDAAIARLIAVLGKPGTAALADSVSDVDVPLHAAVAAFVARTLPQTIASVRAIYPQVDDLAPARLSALVSLVYNRGARLTDRDAVKQDRREMREIKRLLAAKDLDAVPDQLDAMSRLWDPHAQPGLIRRRHDEARLWRAGFVALQLA